MNHYSFIWSEGMRTRSGNKEQDILNAAISVFAEYGFHSAKIAKIAETAGVASGSMYLYFRNKEHILIRIFKQLWQKLAANMQELIKRDDLDYVQKIEGLVDYIIDVFTRNPALAIVFVNEQEQLIRRGNEDVSEYYEQFLDMAEQVFTGGKQSGMINQEIDAWVFRNFAFGGIRHLLHQWAGNPGLHSLETIRRGIKILIKQGVLKIPAAREE